MTDSTWIPPENPDPSEILHSAVDDRHQGHYERALAKHIWYHDNALKVEVGHGGVRLSFAMSYWLDLAAIYPPARVAFILTRDEAEDAFCANPNFEVFHDLSSMNRYLEEDIRTVELFLEAAVNDPELGHELYHVAEPYLISTGHYRECGPFLEITRRLKLAAKIYSMDKKFYMDKQSELKGKVDDRIMKLDRNRYFKNVSTLVALLVINDREQDARSACETALQVIDDDNFRAILDTAMTGQFPS